MSIVQDALQLGWIAAYEKKNALFIHRRRSMRQPHPLLTSGKHSDGFFNSRPVIADEAMLHASAANLLDLFLQAGGQLDMVDRVVGPATGGTKLAECIAEKVSSHRGRLCEWASPIKGVGDLGNLGKKMLFDDSNRKVLPGESVLLCEDVLTTGGSVGLAATAVAVCGGEVLPFILVLVNRSDATHVLSKQVVALITRHMPIWEPELCELCKAGSEAIPPKEPAENWERLNAEYD